MLQAGQKQQAIADYCRETRAGRVEATGFVELIEHGKVFKSPYGYMGWRTGGVALFWCHACQHPQSRRQVRRELIGNDWGDETYSGYICTICRSEVHEFHQNQVGQVWREIYDLTAGQIKYLFTVSGAAKPLGV